jgi:hypothetical protein
MAVHPVARLKAWRRALGRPQPCGVTIRMMRFDGRLQWRQRSSFKLRAKQEFSRIYFVYKYLSIHRSPAPIPSPASKICDSLKYCASHKTWAVAAVDRVTRATPANGDSAAQRLRYFCASAQIDGESARRPEDVECLSCLSCRKHHWHVDCFKQGSQRRLRFTGLL